MKQYLHITLSKNRLDYNIIKKNITCEPCDSIVYYCFEKDNGDCVEQLCSGSPPLINGSPEPGWLQVDGPYIDGSCTGCAMICEGYSTWRIIDQSSNIHAMGSISANGSLIYIPSPFVPQFYNTTGSQTYKLQADYGNNSWQDLDTWTSTISLCGSSSDRFPSHSFSGPWTRQEPYNHKISIVTGQPICNENCADLNPGLIGDGQEWKNPLPSGAYKFTGSVDGEWTNLNNWEDASGNSPARSLPDNLSDVIIDANVTSVPNNFSVIVDSLTITSEGSFAIEAACNNLVCDGAIDRPVTPDCENKFGKITCIGSAIFNGGILDGELINDEAEFNNSSLIGSNGIMRGSAILDNSDNEGLITSNAEFDNASRNKTGGIVEGNAIFRNGSTNTQATVEGDATFYNDSANSFATVEGNAEFYDTSTNDSNAHVDGDATFNDNSSNQILSTIHGIATFNNLTYNIGTCASTATFNDEAENGFQVSGDATFNGESFNRSGALVSGNATFNNTSRNAGGVTGTATFNNSACNEATGTAGIFVPSPPPSCS